MSNKEPQKTKHICNRADFGLSLVDEKQTVKSFLENKNDTPIQVIPTPEPPASNNMQGDFSERKKQAQAKSQEYVRSLSIAWMERIRTTNDPLREKMVLFWHNHFACRTQRPFLAQQQNNLFRKHALGSFADMLIAVSKDPAMIRFLNNQQNRKGHPNENFAREVMELFTLGRGNYTEIDIREAARAFTGWGLNELEEFQFHEKQHDFEDKTFRGQTKNFSGEDIIHSILEDRQTARFITNKIIAAFVTTDVDKDHVDEFAQSFFRSGYNIGKLMKDIMSSDWFFKNEFIGSHVKSPVELIIGIQKQTDSHFVDTESLIFFQRALNQQLFFPPNVGGWPKGKEWIDSSSLAFRMVLPQRIFRKQEIKFKPKDDGDVNSLREKKGGRDFSLDVNWESLAKHFSGTQQQVYEKAEDYLLSRPTSSQNKQLILEFSAKSKNEPDLVKSVFIGLMSLPEYQLC